MASFLLSPVAHNAFRFGLKEYGSEVDQLCLDLFYFFNFKQSPSKGGGVFHRSPCIDSTGGKVFHSACSVSVANSWSCHRKSHKTLCCSL